MLSKLITFCKSPSGAVTVDWVVLCAAVVSLAVLMVVTMTTGTVELADKLMTQTPGDI
ncbi:hypothetical protein [Sulfitobacter litoralis]|uniref:Flp pilus assembly protein, pilin Flp n=1 Tax=Sulfitobacter litoralis TaxID=335975 RepID=A0ABY0SI94_9RHOB|nr:hypothetical protein [Sulfitobacter litoralis]MBQ0717259.1 hypothetical protein [Sulfitobacter litoralis]SDP27010.1 hypothetical protein SAMN04488512_11249 [Sulfitobacter litoralis]